MRCKQCLMTHWLFDVRSDAGGWGGEVGVSRAPRVLPFSQEEHQRSFPHRRFGQK